MFKRKAKTQKKINYPLVIVLVFLVLPSTLLIITELSTDQIVYKTISQGILNFNK